MCYVNVIDYIELLASIEDVIIKTIIAGEIQISTGLRFQPYHGNCFGNESHIRKKMCMVVVCELVLCMRLFQNCLDSIFYWTLI